MPVPRGGARQRRIRRGAPCARGERAAALPPQDQGGARERDGAVPERLPLPAQEQHRAGAGTGEKSEPGAAAGAVWHGQLSVPRRPQSGLRGLLRHDHGARADGGRYYAVLRAVSGEIRSADRQAVQPDHHGGRYPAQRPQAE